MTPDNRALWELLGKWEYDSSCALPVDAMLINKMVRELREVLELPVVISDEDVERAFQHACEVMGGYRTKLCRKSVLAVLESIFKVKP